MSDTPWVSLAPSHKALLNPPGSSDTGTLCLEVAIHGKDPGCSRQHDEVRPRNAGLAIRTGIDWNKAVYDRVEAWHDGSRAASLLAKPSYSQAQSWDKNTEEYCERSGEIGKLGLLFFAPCLENRLHHKELLCRNSSLAAQGS